MHQEIDRACRRVYAFRARDKRLDLGRRTAVMGVINLTPDSFFAPSRRPDPEQAIAAAVEFVASGADIIDVGGESTRPGAQPVPAEEELRRILPVITELRKKTEVLLSVDTRKAEVARKALEAGADIVNDVSGLASDSRIAEVAARAGAGLVVMHMKGTPETMQRDPTYEDLHAEIRGFLMRAVEKAEAAGVLPESILVDPGFGFGKTPEHNLRVLNRLGFLAPLGKPILVGTSRKSFIGKVLDLPSQERLYGTAATVAAAILRGAHVVRVHDVPEMVQVVRMTDAIVSETRQSLHGSPRSPGREIGARA